MGYIFPDNIFNPFLFKTVFFLNYVLDNFSIDMQFTNSVPKKEHFLVLSGSLERKNECETDRYLMLFLLLLLLFSFVFF